MTILGVEFSAPERSVALRRDGVLAEATEAGGRHTAALGMIEKVLAETGVARGEIDTLVVGLGPGSYTGLRVGLMAAKTLAYATGAPLIGFDSLESIARNAPADAKYSHVIFRTFDGLELDVAGRKDGTHDLITLKPQSTAKETADEAQKLAAQFQGWEYEIPSYKYDTIFKALEDLLKPVETPKKTDKAKKAPTAG